MRKRVEIAGLIALALSVSGRQAGAQAVATHPVRECF
jgi:hypothetical protein